ncbi:flagellin lysine-N-methylase [Amphibiibacter pelophylacis]|uniref:Flagellin lysine-N-methylase n=1 Tax=Amphibiibacter pelophylacis TaxID=1799477 RepID=A0ACC6P2W4_9BURK
MSRFSPQAQTPRYLQRFACIGGSCPQSCCDGGWSVTLDRQTWNRYKSIPLHPVNQHLEPLADKGSKDEIAGKLVMRPDGRCPMHNDQGLCDIQNSMGEQALSATCRNFPRLFHSIAGQVHVSATLSCPEAARLALDSADAMTLDLCSLQQFETPLDMPRPHELEIGSGILREVHSVCAIALRDRLLWITDMAPTSLQAMQLWALLVRQVAQWQCNWKAYNQAHPEEHMEQSMQIYTGQLADLLESWNEATIQHHLDSIASLNAAENRSVQLAIMQASINLIQKYLPASSEIQLLLGSVQNWSAVFQSGAERVHELEKKSPWALKNLIRNDLWRNMWYTHVLSAEDLESNFLSLALKYTLTRMLLCASALQKNNSPVLSDVVRITYLLSRHIEHNTALHADWIRNLKNNQLNSSAAALIILGD